MSRTRIECLVGVVVLASLWAVGSGRAAVPERADRTDKSVDTAKARPSDEEQVRPHSTRQRRRLELARRRANPPQVSLHAGQPGTTASERREFGGSGGSSPVTWDPSDSSSDFEASALESSAVAAAGPDLRLLAVLVLDPASGGNADSLLEPGETVSLQVSLANFGNSAAHGVYAQLNPGESNPYVTILDKSADWPDIPAHGTATTLAPHFQVQVSNVLSCGYRVELSLDVRAAGYSATVPVRLDLVRSYPFDVVADATRRYNESDSVTYGADTNDVMGEAVAYGDLNGDGFEEMIVGAAGGDGAGNAKSGAGEVWIVYGSSEGIAPVLDAAAPPSGATVIYGADTFDILGESVSSGDLNGDGFDDLILGAPGGRGAGNAKSGAGEVWVIYGRTTQLPATIDLFSPPTYAVVVYGADVSDAVGDAVSAGDVNGDGFDDLILGVSEGAGAGNAKNGAGEVWIVYGRATQLPASTDLFSPPSYAIVVYGADTNDHLGSSVSAGDVDGDGFDDPILGALQGDGPGNAKTNAGEAWVVYGRATQLPASIDLFSPPNYASVIYGPDAVDQLGTAVSAGDVNGDGYDDLILGASQSYGAGNTKTVAGEAWVVYGRTTQFEESIDLFSPPAYTTVVYGSDIGDQFGRAVSAGDVGGDGFDDLILSATAGDGAGNTKSTAGEVWVIHGRATQLAGSIDLLSPPSNAVVVYGADLSDQLGQSVSSGDLNGDGFDDLILGALNGDGAGNAKPTAGEVHVVYGSSTTTYWNKAETYAFINATTGTNLGLTCDDCSASVPIGFTFPFYGEKFSTIYVSSNGFVSFAPIDDAASATPRCIDSKSPSSLSSLPLVIAPFWDDLDLRSAGAVHALVSGTAPSRRLTVEWSAVPHYPNTGAGTFEVSLFESTGQILYQYQDVVFGNASYDAGAAAVVGVQNRTSAEGTPYSCSQPILSSSQAVSFNLTTPLFKDNMESIDTAAGKPGKWTGSGGAFVWHTLSGASCLPNFHGRTKSLYEGSTGTCSYGNNIAGDNLNFPQISSFPADGRLSFWQRFQGLGVGDVGRVQIQGNGGGYSNLSSGSGGTGVWSYPAPSFLNANAGQTVDLRLNFTTDGGVTSLGWMVDDVRLTGCNAMGIASLTDARSFAQPSLYCGNGVNSSTLDAVGSRCGDGSAPTGYQWLENGVPIGGATSITYLIPPGHAPGPFDFATTVTCPGGSSTSAAQRVTIVALPAVVGPTLLLAKQNDSAELVFSWTDVAGASDYVALQDTVPNGTFPTITGSEGSGSPPGLTVPMPPGSLLFFKVAGRNATCGVGPK